MCGCRPLRVTPSCTSEGYVLSSYLILTATTSLFPPGSSRKMLHLPPMCMRTRSFGPLDLGCYASGSKRLHRGVSVSPWRVPQAHQPPAHPRSAFVCLCVTMINTVVLKANRELLSVCVTLCVRVWQCVSVITCLPPSGCASMISAVCVHQWFPRLVPF